MKKNEKKNETLKKLSGIFETNLKDPVKGLKNIPSQLSKAKTQVKTIIKTTTNGVKSLSKKN